MSRGGEGRASPGGTGRQQGSSPHSDPGCGVPGPPSAHLAHFLPTSQEKVCMAKLRGWKMPCGRAT